MSSEPPLPTESPLLSRKPSLERTVSDMSHGSSQEAPDYYPVFLDFMQKYSKDIQQNSDLHHWDGGQLGVIVEFESKDAAQRAFDSDVFQEYIQINGLESELTLSILG